METDKDLLLNFRWNLGNTGEKEERGLYNR